MIPQNFLMMGNNIRCFRKRILKGGCSEECPERKDQKPYLFYGRGIYHIETSLLICFANQWTAFYMIGTSVVKA